METKTPDQTNPPMAERMREATRQGIEQSYTLNKKMLDAWTTSTEATLKASFDLQNAAIAAGKSLMEPADNYYVALYNQWADTVRVAQKATSDALNATRRLTEQFGPKIEGKEHPAK
jgi:hypothetical protein